MKFPLALEPVAVARRFGRLSNSLMRETIELKVVERFAPLLFGDTEGVRLSSDIRKVTLSTRDPRYQRVGELQRRLRLERNESFFFGWDITRRYTAAELKGAEWFSVLWTSTFEPEGERCGTVYDDAAGCSHTYVPATTTLIPGAGYVPIGAYTCGVGARQVTPLILDGRSIPRGKDFATTIAHEEIVSERAKGVLEQVGITGIRFEPVRYRGLRPKVGQWYQMTVVSKPLEIIAPTVAGVGPFDWDDVGHYRCPHGHSIGLNLLSELSLERPADRQSDVCRTRQCVGARLGVLRPRAILVVSQKVRNVVVEFGLKGWRFEVAHSVNGKPAD
jgi:hypothetical protein